MGRGKIEIKRIENTNNRQVTYSKRRNGIIKKAKEISVLCDAKVSLVIFNNSGKMAEYCSPSTTVADILERYHKHSNNQPRLWDAKHENLFNEIDRIKKENDNMQIELRHLKGEDITSLPFQDLMRLEDALDHGIGKIRDKQMELYKMHAKNQRMLEEENNQLSYMLHKQEMDGGICNNSQERDYNYHIPFGFRVQPMQPNLQERDTYPMSTITTSH